MSCRQIDPVRKENFSFCPSVQAPLSRFQTQTELLKTDHEADEHFIEISSSRGAPPHLLSLPRCLSHILRQFI